MKAAEQGQIVARPRLVSRWAELVDYLVYKTSLLIRPVEYILIAEQSGQVVEAVSTAAMLPIEPGHPPVVAGHGVAGTGIPFDEPGLAGR